ncbi:uncharacterized protein LOC117341313 [Pecten maximus]|uniref:uncharacterized protein LOC117341313 n=1 Tax=Pecten maximus TaxID=6579 RepID=UPI001458AADF|nr:uncharacterized protein LOC117341313 [Pecten maximus]
MSTVRSCVFGRELFLIDRFDLFIYFQPFPNPKTWRPTTTTTVTTGHDNSTNDTWPDITSSPVPRELFTTTTTTTSTTDSLLNSRIRVLSIIIAVLVTVVIVLGVLLTLRRGCGKVCRRRRKPSKLKPLPPAETLYGNAFSIDDEEECVGSSSLELQESPRRRHRKEKKN